jgi:hypothetical protein
LHVILTFVEKKMKFGLVVAAALALSMSACSKDEYAVGSAQPTDPVTEVQPTEAPVVVDGTTPANTSTAPADTKPTITN